MFLFGGYVFIVVCLFILVISMLGFVPVWVLFALVGLVGAVARVALQVYRDGVFPESAPRPVALMFLGAVGGGVAYLLGETYLGALALGFMASDVIENLLAGLAPK